jgi:hypothetical protein
MEVIDILASGDGWTVHKDPYTARYKLGFTDPCVQLACRAWGGPGAHLTLELSRDQLEGLVTELQKLIERDR